MPSSAYRHEKLELYNGCRRTTVDVRDDRRGDTVGTFQIESRAQIQSILQTKPERLYDLVVQVALIRPGPIQARFVHPYTRAAAGWSRDYAHPPSSRSCERTHGVPIFQEQAMSISMALGGFTAARRTSCAAPWGTSRKLPRLHAALERLRSACVANGVNPRGATASSRTSTFANYGFPESHAWSFALIAYATAYLKARYPPSSSSACSTPGRWASTRRPRWCTTRWRHGVRVLPPCLRHGEWEGAGT
jgi:error-prone DNA polymerase